MKLTLFSSLFFLVCTARGLAVDFAQSIRPILSDHCLECHGPDENQRATDLRLDEEAGVEYAFAGGSLDESEAWRRINSDDPDEQMPPPDFVKQLSAAQRELLRQWIEDGAAWSQHWAFERPTRRPPPSLEATSHPIDQFVLAKLHDEGLDFSPSAARETLVRRLKLDLLGLPPTLEEIDDFVGDDSPDAYERLVDRLLASPHFGERMAIEWLDGARFADTNGYQNDFRRSMWPWRDWVIAAFNDNMPFDQFAVEQLAGDLLPNATLQQRIATGFNRNHRTVTEFGSIEEEWLVENVVDRVETTATVFLGLTMGCARCHDHKYDPISQREFYEFFAFFNNVKELGVNQEARGNTAPLIPVLLESELEHLDKLKRQLKESETKLDKLASELPALAENWSAPKIQDEAAVPANVLVRIPLAGDTQARLRDGTLVAPAEESGSIAWNDEILGTVAKFTGLHSLSYGQTIAPDHDRPFSIAFWIKPNKSGAVLDKIDLERGSRGFDVYWKTPGLLELHLIHNWPADALKVSTAKRDAVPAGQWSHVTLSYDGSNKAAGITIRVDGRAVPLKVESDTLKNSFAATVPLRVGYRSRGFTFFGALTDLRYFDEVIDIEIDAVITSEKLAHLPSPIDSESEARKAERGVLFGKYAEHQVAKSYRRERDALHQARDEIKELETTAPTVMVMEERTRPRETFVLNRGEYDKPDESQPVSPDVPEFLGTLSNDVKKDRLALANWLVSPANPLTARVRVNRIWQMLFGVGLVKTSENFGVQAEMPSHPELLDWLATEFVESGWDTKYLLKLIATSQTYRQHSVTNQELVAKDAENRLLARGPRFRMSAELIRDNALGVSGLMSSRIGGPSMRPYQPDKLWDELAGGAGEGKYEQSVGEDLYRRSLYIYRKRTVPHPTTSTFDAPSFEICQVARARTNTPLQALALLNDVTYIEAARKLAERMLSCREATDPSKLAYGFRLATGRMPNVRELETLTRSYERAKARFADDPGAANSFLSHGESTSSVDEPAERFAAYTAVASILLNLDETITKE